MIASSTTNARVAKREIPILDRPKWLGLYRRIRVSLYLNYSAFDLLSQNSNRSISCLCQTLGNRGKINYKETERIIHYHKINQRSKWWLPTLSLSHSQPVSERMVFNELWKIYRQEALLETAQVG